MPFISSNARSSHFLRPFTISNSMGVSTGAGKRPTSSMAMRGQAVDTKASTLKASSLSGDDLFYGDEHRVARDFFEAFCQVEPLLS